MAFADASKVCWWWCCRLSLLLVLLSHTSLSVLHTYLRFCLQRRRRTRQDEPRRQEELLGITTGDEPWSGLVRSTLWTRTPLFDAPVFPSPLHKLQPRRSPSLFPTHSLYERTTRTNDKTTTLYYEGQPRQLRDKERSEGTAPGACSRFPIISLLRRLSVSVARSSEGLAILSLAPVFPTTHDNHNNLLLLLLPVSLSPSTTTYLRLPCPSPPLHCFRRTDLGPLQTRRYHDSRQQTLLGDTQRSRTPRISSRASLSLLSPVRLLAHMLIASFLLSPQCTASTMYNVDGT